jgi:hypothetical protein
MYHHVRFPRAILRVEQKTVKAFMEGQIIAAIESCLKMSLFRRKKERNYCCWKCVRNIVTGLPPVRRFRAGFESLDGKNHVLSLQEISKQHWIDQ